MVIAYAAICTAACQQVAATELALSEFNNTGFQYTFDGFGQTIGPTSVRMFDATNGWGGGGRAGLNLNLSGLADGRFVVNAAANVGHGADNFTMELYDAAGNSGKWQFNSPSSNGSFTQMVSKTTLASPETGVNDWQHLNLGQITSWNVLGQWASPDPFDMSFDRIAISNTVAAPPPYAGYEPDAPWRADAAQRIDAIRKADMTVRVLDATGIPLPGADVAVRMQQHEFGFGSAAPGALIRGTSPANLVFKQKVAELFNVVTLENDLKWPPWVGEWGQGFSQSGTQASLNWLNAQGIDVRGHNMVWPGTSNLPQNIQTMIANPPLTAVQQQSLRNAIAAHIADVGDAVNGKVTDWDVINEPRANHDLMDVLPEGNHAMVDWFNQARAADPNATLYLNEYDIVASGGNTSTSSQQTYFDTLQYLIDQGAPIGGLGMQGHFSESSLTGPEQAWEIFDRFEQLGLDMAITEFDFGTTDQQLQAAFTRDFMTAVFAHEGFDKFVMWGFWEGSHWRPDAAMFRNDWSIKPNGEAYLDLVFNQWRTDEDLQAAADGEAELRGFKGDYLVTASAFGGSETLAAVLTDGGLTLDVTVPVFAGDFDQDGHVDGDDLAAWTSHTGMVAGASHANGDADGDGDVDGADLVIFQRQLGMGTGAVIGQSAVPEPATAILAATAMTFLQRRRRRGLSGLPEPAARRIIAAI